MALLEVNHLHASYAGSVALRDVSLKIEPGEIVGLCGANKAGKSTLCKCLAGTKSLDKGKVLFEGRDVTDLNAYGRFPLGISLCPEDRGIYRDMSVRDNLLLGCDGIPRKEQGARIDQVLGYFRKLAERKGQQAGTLSGGEAQMLGIARRLLRRPKVLIVDEPSLGLDPNYIKAAYTALTDIRKDFGVTVLVVEEIITRLAGWVDRAYVLHLGERAAEGPIDDLIGSHNVVAAYTGELCAMRPEKGEVK